MKIKFDTWKVSPLRTSDNSNESKCNRRRNILFEVNLRCMLACYWLGTGSSDIVKLFSMLRFGSMKHFTRCFTRNQGTINEGIITVCRSVIDNALLNEVTLAINKDYSHFEHEHVSEFVENISNKQFEKVRTMLNNVKLTVSYDMG